MGKVVISGEVEAHNQKGEAVIVGNAIVNLQPSLEG